MRVVDDLTVAETVEECLHMLPRCPPLVDSGARKHFRQKYINCTCTLDTETTNTQETGFIWSYQMNIAGVNVVLRRYSDFRILLISLCKLWKISKEAKLKIHVHNLGYEAWYLIQLLDRDFGVKNALFTSSHKVLSIKLDNGIEFYDSLKLFQKSLAGATKNCKHPKAKGDLDYRAYHDTDTELTDLEWRYIVYDVQGLWEAIENLKREGNYNAATLPLTNTTRVLSAVCRKVEHTKGWIKKRQDLALDRQDLRLAYDAMAGGDTHASRFYANKIIKNCNSFDFKSAHPSQMLTKKFPMGKPIKFGDGEIQDLLDLIKFGYGWIGRCAFTDLKIKNGCPDPVISYSKCYTCEGTPLLDNGRVLQCDGLYIPCDSNDFQRIIECYDFSAMAAKDVFIFKLDYLPEVFRKCILEYFQEKECLPKDTPEYVFAKICVNTIFGACAQRTIRDEFKYDIGDTVEITLQHWQEKLRTMPDEDVIKTQVRSGKLPFLWGLWTASCSRLELWKLIKAVGWDRAIYWDTDSVKFKGARPEAVAEYNRNQIALVEKMDCLVLNRDGKPSYIGIAEDEHPSDEYGYSEFKALHSKCYAYKDASGELECTIAGVSKAEGRKALAGSLWNLHSGFVIRPAGGQKLWYHAGAITGDDSTPVTSWIYMEDREYEVGFTDLYDVLEMLDDEIEIIAE